MKNTAALDVTAGLISAAADAAFTGERAADADVIVPGLELTKREAAVIAIAIAESIVSIVLDAGGKVANLSKPDAERILASRSALSKLDAAVRRS